MSLRESDPCGVHYEDLCGGDGAAAFRKLAETNPITYVHILAAIDPKAPCGTL